MGTKLTTNGERTRWSTILITAAVTAVGTSLASNWLPEFAKYLFERITNKPIVVLEIKRGQQPVSGVKIIATDATQSNKVIVGETMTDDRGIARLQLQQSVKLFFVQAISTDISSERIYEKTHSVEKFPAHFLLDVVNDFREARVVVTSSAVPQTPSDISAIEFQYGEPSLTRDRRVKAVLEVDWLNGTHRPPSFEAVTKAGVLRIEDLLNEVGIELKVVWGNELPRDVMGSDEHFSDEELLDAMDIHRAGSPEDTWHFYLILGGKYVNEDVSSLMFDSSMRRGAAMFDDQERFSNTQQVLYDVIHNIGHMLNLPHPWQAYGDTMSVMTYSWRWGEKWSFENPDVYRFDEIGRQHILRSPERYVRPGRSAFLEYGTQQSWVVAGGSS